LDFQKGWLQYDENGKPIIPPNTTVTIVTTSTGDKFITFANLDEQVDEQAESLLGEEDVSSAEPDYPFIDGGRPHYAFNRRYRYGYDESGALIVRVPQPRLLHFEFAEHLQMGNDLQLRWSEKQVVQAEQRLLKLQ
jgi:hypothetical protein